MVAVQVRLASRIVLCWCSVGWLSSLSSCIGKGGRLTRIMPRSAILSGLTVILYCLLSSVAAFLLAGRKGQRRSLFALLGAIPMVNAVALLYLVSFTDKAVYEKLEAIEKMIVQLQRNLGEQSARV